MPLLAHPRLCVATAKTFLNAGSCVVQPGGTCNRDEPFEACGSPGEVANDPAAANRYQVYLTKELLVRGRALDYYHAAASGKGMVWTNVVLTAPDQLRHRVAFGLSQIIVLGVEGLGAAWEIALWMNWYDIFVRHAFGSYRVLLKEVAYSPLMGSYLTYEYNRAYAAAQTRPDENFAREVMQVRQPVSIL